MLTCKEGSLPHCLFIMRTQAISERRSSHSVVKASNELHDMSAV